MAEQQNFYDILRLDRNMDTAALTETLNMLERTWQQRMVSLPEQAEQMLSTIHAAKQHLTDDAARAEYDRSLAGDSPDAPPAPAPAVLDTSVLNQNNPFAAQVQAQFAQQQSAKFMQHAEESYQDRQAQETARSEELAEQQYLQQRRQAQESEQNERDRLKSLEKKHSLYAWLGYIGFMVLSFLIMSISWKAYPLILFIPLYFAATAALIIYDSTGFSKILCFICSIVYAFLAATAGYEQRGHSAASAGKTWKMFGLIVLFSIITEVVCAKINTEKKRKTRGF